MEPIDLNNHPLTPFFLAVVEENKRAVQKHPPILWESYSVLEMTSKLKSEFEEVEKAAKNLDITGEHGMLAENTQVANVASRIFSELKRRSNVKEDQYHRQDV